MEIARGKTVPRSTKTLPDTPLPDCSRNESAIDGRAELSRGRSKTATQLSSAIVWPTEALLLRTEREEARGCSLACSVAGGEDRRDEAAPPMAREEHRPREPKGKKKGTNELRFEILWPRTGGASLLWRMEARGGKERKRNRPIFFFFFI